MLDAKSTVKVVSLDTYFTVCNSILFTAESTGAPEQMDICSQQKPSSDESDGQHEGEMRRKGVHLFEP